MPNTFNSTALVSWKSFPNNRIKIHNFLKDYDLIIISFTSFSVYCWFFHSMSMFLIMILFHLGRVSFSSSNIFSSKIDEHIVLRPVKQQQVFLLFFISMSCLIKLLPGRNPPQTLSAHNDKYLFSHSLVFSWDHPASGHRSSRVTVPLVSFWGQAQSTEATRTRSPKGGGQTLSGGQPQPDSTFQGSLT